MKIWQMFFGSGEYSAYSASKQGFRWNGSEQNTIGHNERKAILNISFKLMLWRTSWEWVESCSCREGLSSSLLQKTISNNKHLSLSLSLSHLNSPASSFLLLLFMLTKLKQPHYTVSSRSTYKVFGSNWKNVGHESLKLKGVDFFVRKFFLTVFLMIKKIFL